MRSASDGGETSVAVTSPIIPVARRRRLEGWPVVEALFDGGVFTNCAMYSAVYRDRTLPRTSVMATHTHEMLDRALEIFACVKSEFESEHGPLPVSQRA